MRSAAYCCVYATENYIKPTFNWERNSFPACDKDRMRMRYTVLCKAWDGNTHSHGIVCFILKYFSVLFFIAAALALRISFLFFRLFRNIFFSSDSVFFYLYFLLPILIYVMQPRKRETVCMSVCWMDVCMPAIIIFVSVRFVSSANVCNGWFAFLFLRALLLLYACM